ncbi:hypothetical protein V499_03716 [Pseudogymnoascus sp. VKM F-103]|nr:hypothetical protein V499_03716 [Pseudogymnoascus sp. VKM F-103]
MHAGTRRRRRSLAPDDGLARGAGGGNRAGAAGRESRRGVEHSAADDGADVHAARVAVWMGWGWRDVGEVWDDGAGV